MSHTPPPARPLGPDADGQWVRRWTSVEWTRTVDAWVGCRLSELGRRISGVPVTYRARFWSVTRCYPTDEGLVWFKENNPGLWFEPGLVAALADLAPYDVIVPLAVDRERRWLLADDQGTTVTHPEVAHQPTRRIIVRALARLQCTVLGRLDTTNLVELAPSAAGARVRAVAAEWASLAPGDPLHLDVRQEAARAADVLDSQTAALSDTVPLDVELNDVYPANILADRSTGVLRPRFFDFGNAIRGHPFVSLHGFLDSVTEWTRAPLPRADHADLINTYLSVWQTHLSADPAVLRADLSITNSLTNVHRLTSWQRLIPHADPTELHFRAQIPHKYLTNITTLTG